MPPACEHVRDTTTRYDRAQNLLSFLLVCEICGTEQLIQTIRYEPRFEPDGGASLIAVTVQLPQERHGQAARTAA